MEKRPYTTGQIASLCHVTINAVKKWIASGKLSAYRTPGGHYRVKRDDFREFISRFRLHIKEELFPTRKRILIVDDEPNVLSFLKDAIESRDDGAKFEVETAGDGYDALIKVGHFHPDLLVLDIRMPRIDGFEVCRRLREDRSMRPIRILGITAYGRDDMEKIIECGADNCLSKPVRLKEFQKNVEKLLR
jgi:excisionase family DNA binding protein